MERYLGYYRRLLEGMVAGGESQVMDAVPMLGEEEREQLVYEWSRMEKMEKEVAGEIYPGELWAEAWADEGSRRVYIVDGEMEPAPVGVIGEIWLGGSGAEGEGFMPDPYIEDAKGAGAWICRTGALGRWKADGTIDFVGRSESQVRVRGLRVDLGKVEARLKEFAGVKE